MHSAYMQNFIVVFSQHSENENKCKLDVKLVYLTSCILVND